MNEMRLTPVPCLQGSFSLIRTVDWHPNWDLIATGHEDGSIILWNALNADQVCRLGRHQLDVACVRFSPDGRFLVSGSYDQRLKFWDMATLQEATSCDGHESLIERLSFGLDGSVVASCDDLGVVRVWRVEDTTEVACFKKSSNNVRSLAVSSDGKFVASATQDDLQVWDALNGLEVGCWQKPDAKCCWVAFSVDGRELIGGCEDHAIRRWDFHNGLKVIGQRKHPGAAHHLAISGDQTRLAGEVNGDHAVRVWDVKSSKELACCTRDGDWAWISGAAFSPDGTRLVSTCGDESLRIWNAKTGGLIAEHDAHDLSRQLPRIHRIVFSPDGERLGVASSNGVMQWETTTARLLPSINESPVRCDLMNYTNDGRFLVHDLERDVRVIDVASHQEVCRFQVHRHLITSMAIAPTANQLIMTGDSGDQLHVWDFQTGSSLGVFADRSCEVTTMAFSPDGKWLAVGGRQGDLEIWNPETRNRLSSTSYKSRINCLAFSPDSSWLACGLSNGSVVILNVNDGNQLPRRKAHQNHVDCIAFSADSQLMATGGDDSEVVVWSITERKPLFRWKHEYHVTSVAFDNRRNLLASSGTDGTIKLWCLRTKECLATMAASGKASVAWLPDGRFKCSGDFTWFVESPSGHQLLQTPELLSKYSHLKLADDELIVL